MNERLLWKKAVERLKMEIKLRGLKITATSKKLGHEREYLSRYLQPGKTIRWELVFKLLRHLDLPQPFFFASLHKGLAKSHYVLLRFTPDGYAHAETRVFVKKLQDLSKLLPWQGLEQECAVSQGVISRLEELEDQRSSEPERIEAICRERVEKMLAGGNAMQVNEAAFTVGALAIWGTIQRKKGDLEAARQALVKALYCAEEMRAQWLIGRTIHRAAYVLKDHEQLDIGLMLLEKGARHYLLCNDLNRFGQILVAQSDLLYSAGNLSEAEGISTSALDLLSSESWNYTASAQWIRGRCKLVRNDLQGALEALEAAASETRAGNPRLSGCHLKSAGDVLMKLGSFGAAAEKYEQATKVFQDLGRPNECLEMILNLAIALHKDSQHARLRDLAIRLEGYFRNLIPTGDRFRSLLAEATFLLTEESLQVQEIEGLRSRLEKARADVSD